MIAARLLLVAAVLVTVLLLVGLCAAEAVAWADGDRILELGVLFVYAEVYRRTVEPVVVGFRRSWKRGNRENTPDE